MSVSDNPIVIAHHIMWTLYGWWLPNDPRGATSRVIRNDVVAELGVVHFGRKPIQPAGRDLRAFYKQAAAALRQPLLSFAASEFPTIAEAIARAIDEFKYTCYACAIMPDHVHLLIRKHRDLAEDMIEKIQSLSRERLVKMGVRRLDHPTWTRGGGKCFLIIRTKCIERSSISRTIRSRSSWRRSGGRLCNGMTIGRCTRGIRETLLM